MLIVLSPSKTLRDSESVPKNEPPLLDGKCSQPEHLDDAARLMGHLQRLSPAKLSKLMGISDKLAAEVDGYNQAWQTPFTAKNSRPALLTFLGDVYEGLAAEEFKQRDLKYSQQHLRILSGLYGLLRPLDLFQSYRLEMGCKLSQATGPAAGRFKNLYDFWGERIRESVTAALSDQGDDVLINLASNEYFKSVQPKQLDARVITPAFKEMKNGKYKVLSFFAKKARGQMSRFVLLNRLSDPKELQDFKEDDYRFNKELSSDNEPVFTRG